MSISENVDIKATADTNAALSALQQINSNLERLVSTGNRTQESMDGMFEKGVTSAVSFASALGIATTAAGVLNAATRAAMTTFEDWRERQRAAANEQVTFAEAQRRMANQLHDSSLENASKRAIDITRRTGVAPAKVALAMEATLGAMGAGMQDESAFKAVEAAAKFRPGGVTSAEELSSYAQGIVEIRKRFPKMTEPQAAAAMSNMMRADRSTSAEDFTKHSLPGILGRAASGNGSDSLEQLAALPIAIGQVSGDRSGRTTRSAITNLDKQLAIATAPYFPRAQPSISERDAFLFSTQAGEKIRRDLLGPMFGGDFKGDLTDEENPMVKDLAKRIMGHDVTLKGEAKAFPAMREWLNGESTNTTKRILADTVAALPDSRDPRVLAEFNARERDINSSRYQQAAITQRSLAATRQTLQVDDPNSSAGLRQDFDKTLQSAGVGWFDRTFAGFGIDEAAMGGSNERTLKEMHGQMERLRMWSDVRKAHEGGRGTNDERVYQEIVGLGSALKEQLELMKRPQEVKLDVGGGPADRGQMGAAERAGQ